MKLTKIFLTILLVLNILNAKEETININFKNLNIKDLIKITSKIIDKNILMTTKINGSVDFISNKPVKKSELLNILIYVLESKGYTIVDTNGLLRVIRINDASKYNVPVVSKTKVNTFQMVTEIFVVNNANVDYVSSKIRHLISKSAKLVTDKESNSIIVTDFSANINTIKKIISIISKDSKKYTKTIKLSNIDAASIIADIKAIAKAKYNEKISKEKVSVLLSKENNSIMIIGKKSNVNYLVKYIIQLDKQGSLVEKTVKVIYLKNAESKNIIKLLSGVAKNKKTNTKAKTTKKNEPYIASDDESNSIILMGQKKQIKYYEQLINMLDVDRQQVYVQARIIEVSEKRTRDVGIKYGLTGTIEKSTGIASLSAALAENFSMPSIPLISTAGSIINKDILALGASINLLSQNGAADIVSEPSLLCLNNKKSTIYVGQTVSIKTASKTSTGGVSNDSFKREDVGLTLSIKPRISNGNKVLLEIVTKLEDVSKSDGANGQPDTSKKELETTAIVNNGESVILGGYIKSTKSQTIDKVPFFGDIPLIGNLFKNTRDVTDKINLVIIITPYIVPKTKDLTYIRNKLVRLRNLENKYAAMAVKSLKNKQKSEEEKNKDSEKNLINKEQEEELDEFQKKFLGLN